MNGYGPRVSTLLELLDCGKGELRDDVASFLDAKDVGNLAATCARARAALVYRGKLRAVNLKVAFSLDADDVSRFIAGGESDIIKAKPCGRMCTIYSRIDLQRLKQLQIGIFHEGSWENFPRINGALEREIEGRLLVPTIDIAPILGPALSLLGQSLEVFRMGLVVGLYVHVDISTSEDAFAHFANALASLPALRELCIGQLIGGLPMKFVRREVLACPFPALRCLRICGDLCLKKIVRNSLLYLASAPPATASTAGTIEENAPPASGDSEGPNQTSSDAANQTPGTDHALHGKIQALACILRTSSLANTPDKGPGRDFWKNALTPSTTVLSVSISGSLEEFWGCDWLLDGIGSIGVEHLELDHIPRRGQGRFAGSWEDQQKLLFPNLLSMTMIKSWSLPAWDKVRAPSSLVLLSSFFKTTTLQQLVLDRVALSSIELGWLLGRLEDSATFLPNLSPKCRQALEKSAARAAMNPKWKAPSGAGRGSAHVYFVLAAFPDGQQLNFPAAPRCVARDPFCDGADANAVDGSRDGMPDLVAR